MRLSKVKAKTNPLKWKLPCEIEAKKHCGLIIKSELEYILRKSRFPDPLNGQLKTKSGASSDI